MTALPAGKSSFLAAYLKPLDAALSDPETVEIVLNPDGTVWQEVRGAEYMTRLPGVSFSPAEARDLGTAIASATLGQISDRKPLVSGKIEIGKFPVRAQVVQTPVVEGGPAIALRRYGEEQLRLTDIGLLQDGLVDLDAERRAKAHQVRDLTEAGDIRAAMQLCVEERLNVMISGGTSTGKTTFARALLDLMCSPERMVTIEDAFELFPPQPNRVMLKAERALGSERSAARLLECALRLRPDRIILGELRGEECKTFLDAINTGHSGSVTTIHADTAQKALDRLALMVMSVGINMSFAEVRRYAASSIDVVVQLGRRNGRRGILQVWLPVSVSGDPAPEG
ncbi:MAG: ATPase, T2SS/T4P/T4SS family [Marinovum algicola]|uniref:ATPase, T2SS/T4P/T4SS family n=1 Tax=Roseobacteraceae TaxID=2854170 RepID=UPI0032EBFDCE